MLSLWNLKDQKRSMRTTTRTKSCRRKTWKVLSYTRKIKFSRSDKKWLVCNQLNRLVKPPSSHTVTSPRGRGYSSQFRIGVCRQGSQTLTLFKGRKSRIDTLLKAQNWACTTVLTDIYISRFVRRGGYCNLVSYLRNI